MSLIRRSLMSRAVLLWSVTFVSIGLLGCSGEPAVVWEAQSVYLERMEAEPSFAAYGLALGAKSEASFPRQLVLDLVTSEDRSTAHEAIRAIVDNPPSEAAEPLQQAFASERGLWKLQAGIALARLGDAEAMAWVRGQIEESGANLTLAAATTLAENGEQELLEPLLRKRVESDEPTVRNEAYVMLGEIRQPWATALLRKGLEGEFAEARQQAIMSLGRSGDPEVAGEIEKFVGTKGLVFASIEALGELGNPKSVPKLKKMAGHKEDLVRVYAGAALWRLGEEEQALATLEPLVGSEDVTIRLNLAEQLGRVEADRAREMVSALTTDGERDVRLAALRSLARGAGAGELPLLLEAAEDKDYEIATIALESVALIGDQAALERIAPLLDSKNPYIAISAANAVLSIMERSQPAST